MASRQRLWQGIACWPPASLTVARLWRLGLACLILLLVAGADAKAQTVSVWLTTDDQVNKLQSVAPVTFTTGSGGSNPVFVDETQIYQRVEGFGASFTDSAGYLLSEVATPLVRSNAMSNLFTRNGSGIGVSFVRNPMGASDLARTQYSYDDLSSGQTDTNLTSFSIAHDQADIIPLVQQALQLNPQLTIMANPWSPPGWMKTTGSMVGGSLLTNMYPSFAQYFVKYIQAYQAAGIPTHYISLQNEPLFVPGNYPGMSMDAATQLVVLRDYVLPALAASNISARVLVYDHNWDRPDYPDTVLSDATVLGSSRVAGIAWHGYGGTPGVMTILANKYPTKGDYLTEHSGEVSISDAVKADFEEITQVMRNWGKAYVKWSIALDQNHGPHDGGCSDCNPLVTINSSSGALTFDIEYYTLGHFSKFVLPGAYRVYSGNAAGVVSAAFVNPDNSKVLVAFNDTTSNNTFQVQWGSKMFTYTLAPYSGATFTWTGTQSGGYQFPAALQLQASSFNSTAGLETETTTDTQGGYDVGYADGGDYAVYQNVNFGAGFTNVSVREASFGGGTLALHLDSPTGPIISSFALPSTGGWQTWQTIRQPVSGASGLHDLYAVFSGSSGLGNLNWFQFGGALPPAAPAGLTATAGDAQVALSWSASFGATGYNVKRALVSGGPYATITNGLANTGYTDSSVTNGVHYYYVATAVNAGAESTNSNEAAAVPLPAYQQWQMLYFGCTNCPQAQASADPFGKGVSNTNQFLLGLNPTNPASVFRVIAIAPQGTNLTITWKTAGVRTNGVQARSGGDYSTNGFADISGPIIINVTGDTTTNYTDVGVATNYSTRQYRVRLVP
ncbi:MAG TPA: carbohydrate-binding protein [Verrucomicrobiae bacterium]|nr:carbohydrate-binding protein [Verrucomicrobiae bacterium]